MPLFNRLFYTGTISKAGFDLIILVYRVLISFNLVMAHGLPKLGEIQNHKTDIPDPFGIGTQATMAVAIASDVVFPVLVALGFLFRFSILFILGVTLTGLLIVHSHDPWLEKDIPFMYSVSFLFLFSQEQENILWMHRFRKKFKL